MSSVNSPAHGSTRITHILSGAANGTTINVIFDGSTFGSDVKLPTTANAFVWTGMSWYSADGSASAGGSVTLTINSVVVAGVHGHQYGGMVELPTPIIIGKPSVNPNTSTAATFTEYTATNAQLRYTIWGYWI